MNHSLLNLYNRFGGKCYYCDQLTVIANGKGYIINRATRDHVISISDGGKNILNNIVLACECCNKSKHNFNKVEWELIQVLRPKNSNQLKWVWRELLDG